MSLLTRPVAARDSAEPPAASLRSPYAVGALAALQAAAGGLFLLVVPCVLVWIAAAAEGAGWVDAVRVAADGWLLAHGATLVLEQGELSLVPLGLTLLPVGLCWSGARRVARAVEGPDGGVPLRAALTAAGVLVGVYAALVVLVAVLVADSSAHPAAGEAAVGGLVVSALGVVLGLAPAVRPRPGLPDWLTGPARAAGVVLAALTAVSALLVVVALVAGHARVTALATALDPGVVGSAGLLLLELAVLPVTVVWAAAWWAGPGFALGVGSAVSPAATSVGVLPALPLLGAVPEPGTQPGWAALAVAVPVLCGLLGGRCVRRGPAGETARPLPLVRDVAVTALLVALAALVLGATSSGAVGPGRMADLGPDPWLFALVLGGEVLAGGLIGVLLPGRAMAPAWVPETLARRLPSWAARPLALRPAALARRLPRPRTPSRLRRLRR